ncbi:Spc98 family-domain-containing protein [Phyllosticta citribraziliensis]|uniref:Spindle pole body component n=1 Tax=Phyllosticta citribraziliensis TaxID=989973 RepID=A0ABR1MB79_9PEZI
MAHSATINNTGADLFVNIAGSSQGNTRKFKRSRDAFLRGLRSQQWQRVNQFDVQASCEGLVEKFFVLNRQDLAEALSDRLKELSKRSSRWIPEILTLLLHLQGDPVNQSRVEDLEKLKPPEPPPPLTWADIIADDPLDEEGLWDDVDYTRSSDDELLPEPKQHKSRRREITPASSLDEDDWIAAAQACVVVPDSQPLQQVTDGQFWRQEHELSRTLDRVTVTELQAVRETLFMLAGLPTSLYQSDSSKKIGCNVNYSVSHVMASTWGHQLQEFAEFGTGLSQLRLWTKEAQSVALVQTFRAAVLEEIRSFEKFLSELQATFLDSAAVAVSIADVLSRVRPQASLRLRLKDLIQNASQKVQTTPFVLLEALYDEVNLAQMTGEADVFNFLGRIFFACLKTYLKPIRRWMAEGELGTDDQIFFVGTADKSSEAASLWHDQYVLRQDGQGRLHAPSFLHPAARKIFNSGKSVVFLREMGKYERAVSTGQEEPRLDLETVCRSGVAIHNHSAMPLVSFSELFNSAFEKWIRSKYTFASSVLREQLFTNCGLWTSLDALKHVYFSKDGTLLQAFADALFDKIDRNRDGWNDRYLLTEIARSVFGSVASVSPEKLGVRTAATKDSRRSVKALASISIDYFLPWSITNVIQRSSLPVYQRISTLLLQTYRARHILRSASLSISLSSTDRNREARLRTLLRHRLLWFADTLHAYTTTTAIASSTTALRSALVTADDIDAMAALHAAFVADVERRCLLAPALQPIADAVVELLDMAVRFVDLSREGETAAGVELTNAGKGRRGSAATVASAATTGTYRRRDRPRDHRRVSAMQVALVEESSSSDSDDDVVEKEDEDEVDEDGDNSTKYLKPLPADTTTPRQQSAGSLVSALQQMAQQFEQLHGFIVAGLRGVSRAGDERCWEMLAERLEWEGVQGTATQGRGRGR